ncbi:MAG TPA: tRNA lysidine(34) synthetase TilS [Acidobacteriaceae bacterium]|nr:tRNA lysidine(34) synthetase TilS [Acidobacteriaceae bacterium]
MSAKASSAKSRLPALPFDRSLVHPGERVCVAVSGGADSTALLRVLAAASAELGLVLSTIHVHHGIRGAEADADANFVTQLAAQLALPCEVVRVDALAYSAAEKISLETAARNLRYKFFRQILFSHQADVIATAHTLDDQAETVLMKLLRGAWTEGLSGIHPVLAQQGTATGRMVRPLLAVRRTEIEAYLRALNQPWREDASNRDPAHTRNRVRHHLLPTLREYNPNLDEQLARMATLARDEEAYWQAEIARILPTLLLPGRPVRGGGRSVATEPRATAFGMEIQPLLAYPRALRRRLLRAAAEHLGASLDFAHTEALLGLLEGASAGSGRRLQPVGRLQLTDEIFAERSLRELRLERATQLEQTARLHGESNPATAWPQYTLPVPGTVDAVVYGLRYTAACTAAGVATDAATIRAWQPGDRVTLEHSRGPKKVKEVLERMRVQGNERAGWPVVVWQGRVVWLQGARVVASGEGSAPIQISACPLPN